MSIPEEISKKYNMLKMQTYNQIGLDPVSTFESVGRLFEEPAPVGFEFKHDSEALTSFSEYLCELTRALQ